MNSQLVYSPVIPLQTQQMSFIHFLCLVHLTIFITAAHVSHISIAPPAIISFHSLLYMCPLKKKKTKAEYKNMEHKLLMWAQVIWI